MIKTVIWSAQLQAGVEVAFTDEQYKDLMVFVQTAQKTGNTFSAEDVDRFMPEEFRGDGENADAFDTVAIVQKFMSDRYFCVRDGHDEFFIQPTEPPKRGPDEARDDQLFLEQVQKGLLAQAQQPAVDPDPLRVVASITSEQTHDPDDVPFYDDGVCRHYGAFPDSPVPNVRVFVVFNREPKSEEEAMAACRELFGEPDNDSEEYDEDED